MAAPLRIGVIGHVEHITLGRVLAAQLPLPALDARPAGEAP